MPCGAGGSTLDVVLAAPWRNAWIRRDPYDSERLWQLAASRQHLDTSHQPVPRDSSRCVLRHKVRLGLRVLSSVLLCLSRGIA